MPVDSSQEWSFILQVLTPHQPDSKLLCQFVGQNLSWDLILEIVQDHYVPVLFLHMLRSHGIIDDVPMDAAQQLRKAEISASAISMKCNEELVRLLGLFKGAGVEAMPLKGPFLGVSLYADPLVREFSDIDVLVKPHDVECAVEILEKNGYTSMVSWKGNSRTTQLRFQHSSEFVSSCERVGVDLHWALFQKVYAIRVQAESFWEHSTIGHFSGVKCAELSLEDLTIFLCVHGGKHHWTQLRWVCDIDRILALGDTIDWQLVLDRSSRWGVLRMTLLGLGLTHKVLGTELPRQISEALAKNSTITQLIEEYEKSLATNKDYSLLQTCKMDLRLRECWRDKVGYVFGRVFFPHGGDLAWLRLPEGLFPLYYAVHPLRHLIRSCKGAIRYLTRGSKKVIDW